MKRNKTLIILVGALAVIGAATFALTKYEDHKEKIANSDEVILEIIPEEVQKLSWETGDTSLAYHRESLEDEAKDKESDESVSEETAETETAAASEEETETDTASESKTDDVPNLNSEKSEAAELENGEESETESGSETQESGQWLYDEDEAFPVDQEKITELLSIFKEFGVSFIIEDVEDYGQYGLDDPVCTISFSTVDEDYEVTLGNFSNMDSERYVSIGDGNVYLVKTDPLESFDIALSDTIDHDEVPYVDQARTIGFSGAEEYEISYEEESNHARCSSDLYYTVQNEETVPLETSKVNSYLSTVGYLGLTYYVTYNASSEELEEYGLNDPELTVEVTYLKDSDDENAEEEQTEESFRLSVSRASEDREKVSLEELLDPDEEDDEDSEDADDGDAETFDAFIRVGNSKIIYKISSDAYLSLMKASYNDLRHQKLFDTDFEDVTKIDIELEDQSYSITADGKDEDKVFKYKDDEIKIDDLQSALTGISAEEFTEETPAGKQEIAITVALDDENLSEIRLEFYRYDGDSCVAVRDGKTVAFVSRSSVVDLMESVNALVLKK